MAGSISLNIMKGVVSDLNKISVLSSNIYKEIANYAYQCGYRVIGYDKIENYEVLVSPKLGLLFENQNNAISFIEHCLNNRVEAHILFNQVPPITLTNNEQVFNITRISENIVCLPIFFTFNSREIVMIKNTLRSFIAK
jgi:hypothetical protein